MLVFMNSDGHTTWSSLSKTAGVSINSTLLNKHANERHKKAVPWLNPQIQVFCLSCYRHCAAVQSLNTWWRIRNVIDFPKLQSGVTPTEADNGTQDNIFYVRVSNREASSYQVWLLAPVLRPAIKQDRREEEREETVEVAQRSGEKDRGQKGN